MRYLKDIGFVIKRVNLGDSDRYITLFTKKFGKIEVLAKGVRKITSRRSSATELLTLIDFYATKTSKNHILTEVIPVSLGEFEKNLPTFYSLFLICELVDRLCPYGVKNEDIFILIWTSLKKIREKDPSFSMFEFKVKMLSLLGFWDPEKKFRGEEDLTIFIENLIEKKIKTSLVFKS